MAASVVLAALFAPPAAARELFTIHGQRLGGPYPGTFYDESVPQLVDGGVAYVDLPGSRAHVMIRPPGGPSRVVTQFEPLVAAPKKGFAGYLELAGSGRRLAFGRHDYDPRAESSWGFGALASTALPGQRRTIAQCKSVSSWEPQLSGAALLAYTGRPGSPCSNPFDRWVYDLASDGAVKLPAGAQEPSTPPILGGHYVVWATMNYERDEYHGLVYDYRAGRFVNRKRGLTPVAVASTGTVVGGPFEPGWQTNYHHCEHLVAFHAGATDAVTLPYRTCKPFFTKVVGQRIVYLAAPPGRPMAGPWQRLMLGDTSGSPPVPLSERMAADIRTYEYAYDYDFDFDGARVAYRVYDCVGHRQLVVDEVATAVKDGPVHTGPCNATVDVPDEPVDIAKGFDAIVDCPAGCQGYFGVRGDFGATRLEAGGRRRVLSPGRHTLHLYAPDAKPAGADSRTTPATLTFRVYQRDANLAVFKTPIEIREPGG